MRGEGTRDVLYFSVIQAIPFHIEVISKTRNKGWVDEQKK